MTEQSWVNPNTLYVVATPIGNMADLTERAVKTLQQVDLICCEDTRHSARLMEEVGSRQPLISLHEHNEAERSNAIVGRLQNGQSVALISDAGTPLISDPGYVLVNQVIKAGFNVVPIPGVSAVITALSVSGLPTDRWLFEGFLPHKSSARIKNLEQCANESATMVFYESSHRIENSLQDMAAVFGGDRQVVVARELTKTFETVIRGDFSSVISRIAEDLNQRKGEFVVLVAGMPRKDEPVMDEKIAKLLTALKPLMPPKKAAAVASDVFGGSKKFYYETLLNMN